MAYSGLPKWITAKNLPAMQRTWVWSLCQEDFLKKEWQSIPIFLPGKFYGQRSLWATIQFSSVQSLTHVRLFATPWTAAHQASLSITNTWSLLKLMSIESMMSSNHLILCRPLLLPPSIFPSIRVFSNESFASGGQSIGFSPSASVLPVNVLDWISFRMDWLDLLAVQGSLKSLLQHHTSKAYTQWSITQPLKRIHLNQF